EADAVLAVLRGTAPIPTTTTAAPATGGSGSAGTTAPSVKASDVRVLVRNGSGVQNAAGNTSHAPPRPRLAPPAPPPHPARPTDPAEIRAAPSDLAKAPLLAPYAPGAQLVPASSLPGTDVVLALGTNFRGLGSGATATTGAPAPTPTTLSPEAACQ